MTHHTPTAETALDTTSPGSQFALSRRSCLALATLPWLTALGAQAQTTQAAPNPITPAPAAESQLAHDLKARRLSAAGITLDFPPLADTGNAVPLHAELQAPVGLMLTAVEVILPENPNPSVIKLRLIEPQARYAFTTRLRLAASQDAWVIATLSDGSQRGAFAPTVITSSACFDGT